MTKTTTRPAPEVITDPDGVALYATMVDTADVAARPANVRRDLGDLTELRASILAQGIVQPLIVAPNPDPEGPAYVLIAGHRRLAAAEDEALLQVPVVVRADLDTEPKVIEAMLTENLHRADLTPIEEADAYGRLVLFDYTPAQIAQKVGRSESTVRRRLHLAALPDSARDALHAGQITLHDADEIAQVVKPEDTDALKQLTAAAGKGPNELKLELDRLRRRAKFEAAVQEQIDALGTHGVDTVFRVRRGKDIPPEWRQGDYVGYFDGLNRFLEKLAAGEVETPKAMIFESWGVDVGYWYTAVPADTEAATADLPPAGDGEGELPGQQSVEDELAAQREARARAEREQRIADLEAAATIRHDWVHKLVTKRITPVQQATMLRQLVTQCSTDGMIDEDNAALAGLDPEVDWNWDGQAQLRAHADTLSTPALVQLLWALLTPQPHDLAAPLGNGVQHLRHLVELGYEPTSVEAALLAPDDVGEDAGT